MHPSLRMCARQNVSARAIGVDTPFEIELTVLIRHIAELAFETIMRRVTDEIDRKLAGQNRLIDFRAHAYEAHLRRIPQQSRRIDMHPCISECQYPDRDRAIGPPGLQPVRHRSVAEPQRAREKSA